MTVTPARDIGRADVIEYLSQPISGIDSTHRPSRGCHAVCRNVTFPVHQAAPDPSPEICAVFPVRVEGQLLVIAGHLNPVVHKKCAVVLSAETLIGVCIYSKYSLNTL